jgi:hypothetical protein
VVAEVEEVTAVVMSMDQVVVGVVVVVKEVKELQQGRVAGHPSCLKAIDLLLS